MTTTILVDLCNLLNQRPFPRAVLDYAGFAAALRAAGVTQGIVFSHHQPCAADRVFWKEVCNLGVATPHCNIDEFLIHGARWWAHRSSEVVIASGDSGYCGIAEELRCQGLRVSCWAPSYKASGRLIAATDHFQAIDHLVLAPLLCGGGEYRPELAQAA